MNGIEGFVLGMLCGIVFTYCSIMVFAKYMTKKEKSLLIKKQKEKW